MTTSSRSAPPPSVLGVVLALASVATAVAQAGPEAPPPGTFGESVEVEIVTVDVWVRDGEGAPVTGLGPEAFEILHDAQPVAITHFAEMRAGHPVVVDRGDGGASATAAPVPGFVIVYFDQSRLHPRNYKPLIRGLRDLLTEEGVAAESVLVLRQDRALSIAAPFGSTLPELETAFETLARGVPSGFDLEKEEELALRAIRTQWEQNQDTEGSANLGLSAVPPAGGTPGGGSPRSVVGGPGSVGGSRGGPDACGLFVSQIAPILDAWTRQQSQAIGVTLENLNHTASFLAGLPGVKTLIYLSDGLDTQPGSALATYAAGLCPGAAGDLLTNNLAEEMSRRFLELTRHANSNRVTIYSVQAGGLQGSRAGDASSGRQSRRGGGQAQSGFEANKRRVDQAGLSLIAAETGGRAVFNQNELGPELRRIGREMGTFYSLAYEPPSGDEGTAHRIEVRMVDRSLVPRYRRGYLEKSPGRWMAERIEGALNLGITSNPLAVRLGLGSSEPREDGIVRLPLHVMVPVEGLVFLPRGETSVAEVTVQVMARHVESNLLATRGQTFFVESAPEGGGLASLSLDLDLEPGAYVTAVGVQDETSREASFVATALRVEAGQ